jgi:hypothetical protein
MKRASAYGNLKRALSGAYLRRSFGVTLVVGTILNLINQWDFYFGDARLDPWRMLLTYSVPFLVATFGAFSAFQGETSDH